MGLERISQLVRRGDFGKVSMIRNVDRLFQNANQVSTYNQRNVLMVLITRRQSGKTL